MSVQVMPLFGNDGWLAVKAKLFKSTIFLVCSALVLASCANYKARLEARTEPRSAAVILPSPTEDRKVVEGEEVITGRVRLHFDVGATGEVSGVEVIESSDERLSEKAVAMLASWSFEPGTIEGKPTEFEDIEFLMVFFEDTTKIRPEMVGAAILAVLLVAVYVVVDLNRNCGVVTKC